MAVLQQEMIKFNRLMRRMASSNNELRRAIGGLVIMSSDLDDMYGAFMNNALPPIWRKVSFATMKTLGSWVKDTLGRIEFFRGWLLGGLPASFPLPVFFFPQGFMTANVQNYARRRQIPVDTVQFGHVLMPEAPDELVSKPEAGCYVTGLFLEGARWDKRKKTLTDPKPKELFAPMPVIHLVPEVDRAPNPEGGGIYRCPVYKILTRTGTLSTTGHSTNFVFWLEVPSSKPTCYRNSLVSETNAQIKLCDQAYWIKAGAACFCALKY